MTFVRKIRLVSWQARTSLHFAAPMRIAMATRFTASLNTKSDMMQTELKWAPSMAAFSLACGMTVFGKRSNINPKKSKVLIMASNFGAPFHDKCSSRSCKSPHKSREPRRSKKRCRAPCMSAADPILSPTRRRRFCP